MTIRPRVRVHDDHQFLSEELGHGTIQSLRNSSNPILSMILTSMALDAMPFLCTPKLFVPLDKSLLATLLFST